MSGQPFILTSPVRWTSVTHVGRLAGKLGQEGRDLGVLLEVPQEKNTRGPAAVASKIIQKAPAMTLEKGWKRDFLSNKYHQRSVNNPEVSFDSDYSWDSDYS